MFASLIVSIRNSTVFKERFQEILEFTKSESPYSKVNKGWINQDIFLEFGKSSSTLSKQKEAAKVTLLWPPIQKIISNLLIIIIISSLIVLTTLNQSKINFNLQSFALAFKDKLVQLDNKESNLILEDNQIIDSNLNPEIEEDLPKEEIYISNGELSNQDDSLKTEDNIAKDLLTELEDEISEEVEIKNDVSIKINKKSKSNFI